MTFLFTADVAELYLKIIYCRFAYVLCILIHERQGGVARAK